MICEPAMQILRKGLKEWDTQCALHRLSITGDWTELDELDHDQLAFALTLCTTDELRARVRAAMEGKQ
jgi:hypothetical protein